MAFSGTKVNRMEVQKDNLGKTDRIFFSVTISDDSMPDIVTEVAGRSPSVHKETRGLQYFITGFELEGLPAAAAARKKAIRNIIRREASKEHVKWMSEIPKRKPDPQRLHGSDLDTELGVTGGAIIGLTAE